MPAFAERQRVAIMLQKSWLVWRAVCDDHGIDVLVPNWMSNEVHDHWIFAQLDAVEHNIAVGHTVRAKDDRTWEQVMSSATQGVDGNIREMTAL